VPSVSTVQLCVHCRQRPAGFWVSRGNAAVVHRPWCLGCCDQLDRAHCAIVPFDVGRPPAAGPAVIRASAQRRLLMSLRDAWRTP